MPASLKESGSVVTDLIKWADLVPLSLTAYFYGNTGNIYSRSSAGSWTNLHTTPSSHGNGLAYFSGDDYVYYTADSTFGRYGPTQSSPQFTDNFLAAQGGIPLNTASISLLSASSMYATAADSATLSVTGNLTLETFFKATTLPTVGNSMTLVGKWDENANTRSYKLDLYGVSGYFGDGSDSSLTISSNTTEAPTDSACTGTAGTQSLSATNASFAVNQVIYIHQTRGTNAGQYERNTIQGYTAGTITLGTSLLGTYVTGAQVRVVPQYTNVTINSGFTYTAKAWNGTVGGILAFLYNGTLSGAGNLSANGKGFRGGAAVTQVSGGNQGEGTAGAGTVSAAANGNGGGGGQADSIGAAGGGGGGNSTVGETAANQGSHVGGIGGSVVGATDLSNMVFGGGGGSGGAGQAGGSGTATSGAGGNGGGIIYVAGVTDSLTGTTTAYGLVGGDGTGTANPAGGGGGAAGSILRKSQVATLGTNLNIATGGAAGHYGGSGGSATNGVVGGNGYIVLDYLTSYSGTTSPTLNAIQDNTLVTTTTIQARLGISNNGTAFEYLTKNLTTLSTATWNRLSVSWVASTSTATFYLNAVSLGTSKGTKTAISDNASLLYVGADKGASAVGDFFNGLLNDMRIWGTAQTASQIYANNLIQLTGKESGLKAYYKLPDLADSTANTNTLTGVNTPTFVADVPFPAPTTRLDIDTQSTTTGQTYTLLTAISEAAADKLSFTPINDPQASVGFYIDTLGTGDFTVTVHDQQNRTIATSTIVAANLPASGFVEFFFSTPWRIIIGKSYHIHLTVSTGTSKVITNTASTLAAAQYATYFGYLVTDTQFHPAIQFQYQPLGGTLTGAMIFGNERYLAVWDGANYYPNFIAFPPAWKVRCFGFWREYLAIGMWRGGNIYDFTGGRIYFWDGVSPAFSFFIDVPDGQINAMFGVDTDLYFFAGYRGELLDYKGGYFYNSGNSASAKLKRMPLLQPTDYTEVYPGALTMWRGLLHFGLMGNSNSTIMQRGVYSFGTLNQFYPDTLSYDYVVSTGNNGSTVTIGCVFPVGQKLIVCWQDGIAYGADQISFSNPPASSGEIQILVADDGALWKDKAVLAVKADVLPLLTGESVASKVSTDRSAFTLATATTTVGSTFNKLPVSNGRSREYQIGAELYATGTTSPTLVGLSLLKEKLDSENQF